MPSNKKQEESTTTAVQAQPQGGALATLDYDLEDLDQGFEETTAGDFKLPFLRPLQKLSPQADADSKDYIPGAKAGTFINTATGELIDGKDGFLFIPVHRTHQYLEFVPRDQGGGFVASYEPDAPEVAAALKAMGKKFGKAKIGDSNELIETYNMYGLYVADDAARPVVVPFASSAIDAYKTIMSKMDLVRVNVPGRGKVRLPMFAHQVRLTTRFTENKKGSWHKMFADFEGGSAESARLPKDSPLFAQAKAFRDLVLSGRTKVEHEASGATEAGTEETVGVGNEKGAF